MITNLGFLQQRREIDMLEISRLNPTFRPGKIKCSVFCFSTFLSTFLLLQSERKHLMQMTSCILFRYVVYFLFSVSAVSALSNISTFKMINFSPNWQRNHTVLSLFRRGKGIVVLQTGNVSKAERSDPGTLKPWVNELTHHRRD